MATGHHIGRAFFWVFLEKCVARGRKRRKERGREEEERRRGREEERREGEEERRREGEERRGGEKGLSVFFAP